MFDSILEILGRLWSVQDSWSVLDAPDVIGCITYCMSQSHVLTKGSTAITKRVAELANTFPRAVIVYDAAAYAPGSGIPDISETECQLKTEIWTAAGVKNKIIYSGTTLTTIDSAERCRDELRKAGISPRKILLVTGEVHSRSARYVWRKFFPDVKITFDLIPLREETQPDAMIRFMRRPTTWFVVRILQFVVLRTFGMNFVRRFIQPASE